MFLNLLSHLGKWPHQDKKGINAGHQCHQSGFLSFPSSQIHPSGNLSLLATLTPLLPQKCT
jgi:hypothetical protein